MANKINIIIYAIAGEIELNRKETYGYLGAHGYTYDVDVEGKKKIAKDVPTTTGYYLGKGNSPVVQAIDVMSLMVTRQKDKLLAILNGFHQILELLKSNKELGNVGFVSKFNFIEKLMGIEITKIKEKENKYAKLVFTDAHYEVLESAQNLYNELKETHKFWFSYDDSVEGGLGMRSANEQSATAEICSMWGTESESILTFTPQKAYWNPETDFNRVVSGTRWYFNTMAEDQFYGDYDGYRRYDFGKLDKKKYYGKVTPDVTYGSLFTKTPVTLLDKLFGFCLKRCKNPKGLMLAGDLQFVKSKAVGRLIDSYPGAVKGKDVIMPFTVGGRENPTLIEMIDPPGLSYRIQETFDDLGIIFKAFLNRDENNRYGEKQSFIDITSHIYDIEENGKGVKKIKMNKKFRQSTPSITITAHHYNAVKPVPVQLGVSFDLPTYNGLNSVSDIETKVWVNIEESDDKCLRYRTIVISEDWVYIHTSAAANVRVLSLAELGKL